MRVLFPHHSLPELDGGLGQQLYCCPLRRSGSTTAEPTGNLEAIHRLPLNYAPVGGFLTVTDPRICRAGLRVGPA